MLTTSQEYQNKIIQNVRQFASKVEIYFDGPNVDPVTFYSDDYVVGMSLLEEYHTHARNPLGLISSNEISIILANPGNMFTPTNTNSPYYTKLLPNLLVKPFIGLVLNWEEEEEVEEYVPEIEYIPLGQFYTGDWMTSGNDLQVNIRCTDGISKQFNKRMLQVPIQENTSTKDLFEKLFTVMNIDSSSYEIDESLSTEIRYGWFEGNQLREVIQNLANNSCCSVFINRYGKIIVRNNYTVGDPVLVLTDQDQVISSQAPQKYSKVYSTLDVEHGKPYIGRSTEIFSIHNVGIDQDGIDFKRGAFRNGPVAVIDHIVIQGSEDVEIDSFSYGAWDFTLRLLNHGPSTDITIIMYGTSIEFTEDVVKVSNEELVDVIGDKNLSMHPYLVQDESTAVGFGNLLLGLVSDPIGHITAEIIGNPALELGDTITIQNPTHAMDYLDVVITKLQLQYQGGLTCHIEGISRESRIKFNWVSVSPGMYNLVPQEVS